MKTNELIAQLSQEMLPVPRHAAARRLLQGAGSGFLVSALAVILWLGVRRDLAEALLTSAYWMKFAFTLLLAAFGFWATARLARPGRRADEPFFALAAVFAALFAIAAIELMRAGAGARMPLVMGHSSQICPWLIAVISLPIFTGTFWSLRHLAPTRPVLAGAVAGFASGALGAWIYSFHCDEIAAPFVLIFYTFGIAIVGAVGAAAGRRLLRW